MSRKRTLWSVGAIALVVVGVLTIPRAIEPPLRRAAVPLDLTVRAEIPGIPGARYFVGLDLTGMVSDVVAARDRERAFRATSGETGELPPAELLALSGGGDKGAFGAGLLYGWTQTGTRPTFKAVTGVSTGSLIAPFAFVGPEYDEVLKTVYTTVAPTDIARPRTIIAAIRDDGMADNAPLWTLISKYVDQKLLDRIAQEYARGRLLLVGTTDLDARQPVIWNLGAIASSGAPQALELFRSILLASAAIPGAFPPTMIDVEVGGERYQEMHVDGGASAQVFLYPPAIRRAASSIGETMYRQGRVYVVRNASINSNPEPVRRQTMTIAARAIDSLIHTQGIGDLFRIFLTAQRDGLDFNLAYIGPDFVYENKKEQFETAYMVKLFQYGYELGRNGYPWRKLPPGFDDEYSAVFTSSTSPVTDGAEQAGGAAAAPVVPTSVPTNSR
jgi:predicted acylesterase/phospholipase RssA